MKDILQESLSSWENVTKSDNIFIYKTMKPGKSNVFVRGTALLPDIDKETAFLAIYKEEFRIAWYIFYQLSFRDRILRGFKIVARESDLVDVITYYVPAPLGVISTREFLQKRILRKDFPEKN